MTINWNIVKIIISVVVFAWILAGSLYIARQMGYESGYRDAYLEVYCRELWSNKHNPWFIPNEKDGHNRSFPGNADHRKQRGRTAPNTGNAHAPNMNHPDKPPVK